MSEGPPRKLNAESLLQPKQIAPSRLVRWRRFVQVVMHLAAKKGRQRKEQAEAERTAPAKSA